MGTNSIKVNLNKDSIISNIKLLLGADTSKKKVFLIVEGDDDIKFLRKFCEDNVTIYESFSGKNGVEEIVNAEEICNDRVIGIRDRDYCSDNKGNKIFFYDRCCLEMMIIECDESFNSIYSEFYQGTMKVNELKEHILTELYELSYIRKYNEEYNKCINFNGLSFNSLINNEGKLDNEALINNLICLNSGKNINFSDIVLNLEQINTDNLLDITNGHDFILFFKVLCDKQVNKNSANEKQISSALRASFNKASFKRVSLYTEINTYFANEINVWTN